MSEVVEREDTLSVLVSSVGAWLGLGAGVAMLVLTLLGCLHHVFRQEQETDIHHTFRAHLTEDLLRLAPGGARVTDSGDELQLDCSEDGRTVVVTYRRQDGHLFRVEGMSKTRKVMANGAGLNFTLDHGLLQASMDGQVSRFALERWGNR